jgi:hypoxanthine phosphoribosyltransferase
MDQSRKEFISWREVYKVVSLIPEQFTTEFDSIIMVSPKGIIPAGILAAATGIDDLFVAKVEFPPELEADMKKAKLFSWPTFKLFPEPEQLEGKQVLVVNNAWGSGRTTWAVNKQVECAGGFAATCVLHFNPYRNLLKYQPDFYGAITDAYIIYPWEIDPLGPERIILENGGKG